MSVVIKGIAEELSKGKQKAERATQWFIKLIDSGFFKQHVETMLDIAVLPGLELNYGVAFGISQYGVKYPLNILEQLLKI